MTKTIVITVSPSGESRVQTHGFLGAACQAASRFIELALGNRLGELLTHEFHLPQQTSQQQTQGNGQS